MVVGWNNIKLVNWRETKEITHNISYIVQIFRCFAGILSRCCLSLDYTPTCLWSRGQSDIPNSPCWSFLERQFLFLTYSRNFDVRNVLFVAF